MLLNQLSISASTGEKPQSKLWFHDGFWWAVLPNSSGTKLWKLQNQTWVNTLNLSNFSDTHADAKVVGNLTHILLYRGQQSQLVSVEYSSGAYQLWSGRPNPANISLGSGVETATIDIDSRGRMWLAYEANNAINVQWSDSPYATWQGPTVLATGVNDDDICVVTALPSQKIGVLWSNQNAQRFGFRIHADSENPTTWSTDEVPASQSAQSVGGGMADDHLNVAVASDGTLYAVVKTEYPSGYPKIALLVRRSNGSWDNLYEVDQAGTRPIVLLNEVEQKILVAYTSETTSFAPIVYKTSSTVSIAFGNRQTLLSNSLNNATSTKANYKDEVLVLSSDATTAQGSLFSTSFPSGWWLMNEGSGTVLIDASANGNNGTIFGNPTWVKGIKGLALRQNGSNQYAVVPNSQILNITSNITLAAWIKPEKIATQRIIDKVVIGQSGYSLFLSGGGLVSVRFNDNNTYRLDSSTSYPTNGTIWMHVAASYNGSTIRLYINGVENISKSVSFSIVGNSNGVGIGAAANGNNSLQGTLDNIRIYNRALSLAEIQALAASA